MKATTIAKINLERRRPSGQSLIEFALVLPIFLVILFSLFELGRALVEYNSLANAAREGARAGIVPTKTVTEITQAARSSTVTAGALPAVEVLAFRSGTQLADPATRTSGDSLQVRVSHTFVPIFFIAGGFSPSGIGGLGVQIPMSSTARMRVE